MVHPYLAPVGDTYWVQRVNASTSASGASVTVNDTAPTGDRYNMSTVEIVSALITDTTFPTVAITTPADNAPVSGQVAVSATAGDNIGVVGVQFKLDNVNLGAEVTTGNPYTLSWNTGTATNAPHVLTAVARDGAGNATTSAQVHVTVNNVDSTFADRLDDGSRQQRDGFGKRLSRYRRPRPTTSASSASSSCSTASRQSAPK